MKQKLLTFLLLFFITILLTSCQKWIEFDLSRMAFGFIFSLVIGVIGLIFMISKGGTKNK
jgi:ABC-type antimicrobial peptide transport system permease subunit